MNPYSPPQSSVDHSAPLENSPALWNPNAAASWSLLFTPIFGAWLHMKNWQAMGEHEKSASSKKWIIVNVIVLVLSVLIAVIAPDSRAADGITRLIAFVLLISWYYASGREQTKYVIGRYGERYRRKGWMKPLLCGVLGLIGFIALAGVIGLIMGAMLYGNADMAG